MPANCQNPLETLILGSGPAGLTAAIYAARSRCCPLVIHGRQPGGQLTTTTVIENYPGFVEGIDGNELMQRMQEQAKRFGTQFVEGEVTRVELTKTPFRIWLGEECYQSKTLIITSGASPKMLGLDNEWELYGRGVSVCATCDGFFYKEKDVVVVGGGDTAMEEASFLARFARKVTVVHRRDELRASPPLQKRTMDNKKISFRWNTEVVAIHGDKQQGVHGLRLRDNTNGEEEDFACHGVFIAIGHTPNTDLFKGQLHMDQDGYILTKNACETNIPGVFAAGDVQDPNFRQAITAAGSGCMAAMLAERYLDNLGE
ncbi:thioredoxin reductase (NADPH) [Geoalkalibacter ferrihydriticus]|uniref:Thioredoxin reductase n=2 Tax=Geoalkalibacter ferrihydriticus TaxID=392333 RepID=A0A0C2DRA4_9BACT|nr:thioredoxin-disulfide reductase [Geoalkalibacter ferrihydriticus]KIH75974.1 thioredoxin reductase [Geoalkalibacter ferrihydriticus DSM 17813]SDM57897.1 thioredoxin reductase (NADPH) [Geoalkalibacter ferrihydriticus]